MLEPRGLTNDNKLWDQGRSAIWASNVALSTCTYEVCRNSIEARMHLWTRSLVSIKVMLEKDSGINHLCNAMLYFC